MMALVISLAIDQARQFAKRTGESPVVTLQYVCVPAEACPEVQARGYELLRNLASGHDYPFEAMVTPADDVVDGIVQVQLQGACRGCPMSQMTLAFGIERVLKAKIPEVISVQAV